MRAAAALLVLALLAGPGAGGARAQDAALWARLDRLLAPALRRQLPSLLRLVADYCHLTTISDADGDDYYVVEHGSNESVRYAVSAAGERMRAIRPERLALYVGGWGNAPEDAAARSVLAALRRDHDLVLELDVRAARAGPGYTEAAARVPALAGAVGTLLAAAAEAGTPLARVHCVGFSLGAHAVGVAARMVRSAGHGELGRLTALDPARPCFVRGQAARRWRLASDDAGFVHVVHSSAGLLGLARRLGHVDVYVRSEGGAGAAGAAGMMRAHQAAWRVWSHRARARRCAGLAEARAARCRGAVAEVGYGCTPDVQGVFLLDSED